jgi:hypothetical protein
MIQPGEHYCAACSLNVENSQPRSDESFVFPARKFAVLLLIIAAAGLLLWFIVASCASGLSDS